MEDAVEGFAAGGATACREKWRNCTSLGIGRHLFIRRDGAASVINATHNGMHYAAVVFASTLSVRPISCLVLLIVAAYRSEGQRR